MMNIKCPDCGSDCRMQVTATISAPAQLSHNLSKRNLRRADTYILGVKWETADYICAGENCGRLVKDGYGNYVSGLEKRVKELEEPKVYLAWQHTHRYLYECGSDDYEHVIDADTDIERLRERINAYHAQPDVVRFNRGNVMRIESDKMKSESYSGSGGGCSYTCYLEIKEAPRSKIGEK